MTRINATLPGLGAPLDAARPAFRFATGSAQIRTPAVATLTDDAGEKTSFVGARGIGDVIAEQLRGESSATRRRILTTALRELDPKIPKFSELRHQVLAKQDHLARAKTPEEAIFAAELMANEVRAARYVVRELEKKWGDKTALVIERPSASRAHLLQEAFAESRVGLLAIDKTNVARVHPARKHPLVALGQVFVVQHDWAALVPVPEAGAEDQWRLPFDDCCFEFRISGVHVIALAQQDAGSAVSVTLLIELPAESPKRQWVNVDRGALFGPLLMLISKQIAACCIALEAEVVETEVVRVPHRLNSARERRGKLPIADHHVVTLARRMRASPVPAELRDPDAEKRQSPRLHFRAGHWRHYQTYRMWMKWQLVGDPDLGVIGKEYRA